MRAALTCRLQSRLLVEFYRGMAEPLVRSTTCDQTSFQKQSSVIGILQRVLARRWQDQQHSNNLPVRGDFGMTVYLCVCFGSLLKYK